MNKLHIMRACVALRIAARHLERAEGSRAEQAAELVILAAELLAECGSLSEPDLLHALLQETDVATEGDGNGDRDGVKQAH